MPDYCGVTQLNFVMMLYTTMDISSMLSVMPLRIQSNRIL